MACLSTKQSRRNLPSKFKTPLALDGHGHSLIKSAYIVKKLIKLMNLEKGELLSESEKKPNFITCN